MSFSDFTIKTAEETLKEFNSSEFGLSEKEAEERLNKFGPNTLKEKRFTFWLILLRQFKSPFIYLLIFAAILSLFFGAKIDAATIAIVLAANALLGFFQEFRSEKSIERLKSFIVHKSKVRRQRESGEKAIETLGAAEIVPGDVVLVEKGDIISADLRMIKSRNLEMDESILTGEPYPVLKTAESLAEKIKSITEARNLIFAGTAVASGFGEGVVVATGAERQIGKIAKLVSQTKHKSVFEENIEKLSKFLLKIVTVSLALIFFANIFIKGGENISELFLFTIALAIGIVPEALPVVAALTMSRGALRLAKKGVVVKRLSAIEDLGDIEILCTDKTGTITKNKMEVADVFAENKESCLLFGLISSPQSDFKKNVFENPFDEAIWNIAGNVSGRLAESEILYEMPFDPILRVNAVAAKEKNDVLFIIKGAPEEILRLSRFKSPEKRKDCEKKFAEADAKGFRTIAIAFKKLGAGADDFAKNGDLADKEMKKNEFEFCGLISFRDPLKKTAIDAARLAKKLGIELKIITGDAKGVAETVGREIGLVAEKEEVFDADHLLKLNENDFETAVKNGKVFARVSPELKQRIVTTLNRFAPVGFLGEGVNDAPALKSSRVAIVVDSGADVSKEVGDIILLKKDLHTIIDGIREGRGIFSNIHKYLTYTLIGNFGNLYTIAAISLVLKFLPMLPSQILLANLITDIPMLAIAADAIEKEEIKKPKKYDLKSLAMFVLFFGFIDSIFDFIFFGIFSGSPEGILRTLWFLEVIFSEIILIFSIRTGKSIFKSSAPSKILVFAAIFSVLASVAAVFSGFGEKYFHFAPPPFSALAVIGLLGALYFIATEWLKIGYWRISGRLNGRSASPFSNEKSL